MIRFNKFIFFIFIIMTYVNANAASSTTAQKHTKIWTTAPILGSFAWNTNFKYYIQPELRLIDDKYKFEQTDLYLGLGYQTRPNLILLGGVYRRVLRHTDGAYLQEYRLWEQADWSIFKSEAENLASRSRLEERKDTAESQWAIRFRQRFLIRENISNWDRHSIVAFDELFFNINKPKWVSPNFFAENRFFVGIGTQFSEQVILDIGYLNQYQIQKKNQINNILFTSLNVSC